MLNISVPAFAESYNGSDLFTVDIPEGYHQTPFESGSAYNFTDKNGDTFSVTVKENTDEFCVNALSQKDIEDFKASFLDNSEEILALYKLDIQYEYLSAEKVKTANKTPALACVMKNTVSNDKRTEVFYQKFYEFGGVERRYNFTYTTKDKDRLDSMDASFESIVINEAQTKSIPEKLAPYGGAAVLVLLLLLGIVRFIKK